MKIQYFPQMHEKLKILQKIFQNVFFYSLASTIYFVFIKRYDLLQFFNLKLLENSVCVCIFHRRKRFLKIVILLKKTFIQLTEMSKIVKFLHWYLNLLVFFEIKYLIFVRLILENIRQSNTRIRNSLFIKEEKKKIVIISIL